MSTAAESARCVQQVSEQSVIYATVLSPVLRVLHTLDPWHAAKSGQAGFLPHLSIKFILLAAVNLNFFIVRMVGPRKVQRRQQV